MQAMRSLNNGPEKQEGLRRFSFYQEIDDQTGFSLIYEWKTQEDCERYLDAEKFKVLLGALRVLCEKSEMWCSYNHEKKGHPCKHPLGTLF